MLAGKLEPALRVQVMVDALVSAQRTFEPDAPRSRLVAWNTKNALLVSNTPGAGSAHATVLAPAASWQLPARTAATTVWTWVAGVTAGGAAVDAVTVGAPPVRPAK